MKSGESQGWELWGQNTSEKRDCNGFIQHFGRLALWWRTIGRSGWRSSVINSSSTSLADPSCKAPKMSSTVTDQIFLYSGKSKQLLAFYTFKTWKEYILKSKNQNCTKFSLRDPHVLFNSKVLRFDGDRIRLLPNIFFTRGNQNNG